MHWINHDSDEVYKVETNDLNDANHSSKKFCKYFIVKKIKIGSNKVVETRKKISEEKMKQIEKEIVIDFKLSKNRTF